MIGHFAGTIAQFSTYYVCSKASIVSQPVCNLASIFVHEFVVEPVTNSYIVNYISQQVQGDANDDKKSVEHHSSDEHHHHSDWGNIISGAVFAVIFSYIANYFIGCGHHDDHNHNHSHLPEAAMSLMGSFVGQNLYSYIFGHEH